MGHVLKTDMPSEVFLLLLPSASKGEITHNTTHNAAAVASPQSSLSMPGSMSMRYRAMTRSMPYEKPSN
jgi:hypothetical protein